VNVLRVQGRESARWWTGALLAAVLLQGPLAGAQPPPVEPGRGADHEHGAAEQAPRSRAQRVEADRDASPRGSAAPGTEAAPRAPAARAGPATRSEEERPAPASTPTSAPPPRSPTAAAPTRTATRAPTPAPRSTGTAAALPNATRAAANAAPFSPVGAGSMRGPEGPVLGREASSEGGATFFLGALVALIAAALGFGAGRSRERAERRKARRGLSTGVLAELRRIDGVLRKMITQDSPSTSAPLDHPIIEASLRDLPLFRPETAARIAHFHTLLRSVQATAAEYREKPMLWAGRLREFNQLLKARAAAACRAVPELTKALRDDGGITPPAADKAEGESEGKALPPPPFDSTETDDWTM
jgi:hypothetical protein